MTASLSGIATATAAYSTEEIILKAQAKRAEGDIKAALKLFELQQEAQMTADGWFYKGVLVREANNTTESEQKALKCFKKAQALWLAEKRSTGKLSLQATEFAVMSKLLGNSKLHKDAKALIGQSNEVALIEKIRLHPPSPENALSSELLKELNKINPIQAHIILAELLRNAGVTHKALAYLRLAISTLFKMHTSIREYSWKLTDHILVCLQMMGDLYEYRGLPQEADYIYKLGIKYSQELRLPLVECQFMRGLCCLYIHLENFSAVETTLERIVLLTNPLDNVAIQKNEKLTGDFLRSLCEARKLNPAHDTLLTVKTTLTDTELLHEAKKHYLLAEAYEEVIYIDYLEGDISGAQAKWERLPSPRAIDLFRLGNHTKNPAVLKQALSICLKQGSNTPLIRDIYLALTEHSEDPATYHARSIGVTADWQLQALKSDQTAAVHNPDPPLTIDLPHNWVAVSASICENSRLRITRWEGGKSPVSQLITGTPNQFTLLELESIIKQSNETLSRTVIDTQDKKMWWNDRRALDEQLKQFLQKVEDDWLGPWKVLLAPHCPSAPSEKEAKELLYTALNKQVEKIAIDGAKARLLIASISWLSQEQLAKGIHQSISNTSHDESLFFNAASTLKSTTILKAAAASYFPVTLLLGKQMQALPWESLPILRKTQVTRMPSVALMQMHLKERQQQKITKATQKTFYILNPSNNLEKTQERFEEQFAQRPLWDGVCAEIPSKEQFIKALTEYDLFVYCDHNSGERYLTRDCIREQITKVRSIALLMGCSSAAMTPMGKYDPSGIVISYMLSSCPAVVGNLWDVTDVDIDRYLQKLLDLWVDQKRDDEAEKRASLQNDLLSSISQSREACNLKYLVAAAPVVYGMPPDIELRLEDIF